jgi:hypothetical protein
MSKFDYIKNYKKNKLMRELQLIFSYVTEMRRTFLIFIRIFHPKMFGISSERS